MAIYIIYIHFGNRHQQYGAAEGCANPHKWEDSLQQNANATQRLVYNRDCTRRLCTYIIRVRTHGE